LFHLIPSLLLVKQKSIKYNFKRVGSPMSWHKLTLKVIDVLALLGHRCLGTHHLTLKK
jgi:hypothetical protein